MTTTATTRRKKTATKTTTISWSPSDRVPRQVRLQAALSLRYPSGTHATAEPTLLLPTARRGSGLARVTQDRGLPIGIPESDRMTCPGAAPVSSTTPRGTVRRTTCVTSSRPQSRDNGALDPAGKGTKVCMNCAKPGFNAFAVTATAGSSLSSTADHRQHRFRREGRPCRGRVLLSRLRRRLRRAGRGSGAAGGSCRRSRVVPARR